MVLFSFLSWKGGGSRNTWGCQSCHSHWRTEWQEQVQTSGGGGQPESCHGNAWSEWKQDHFQQYLRGMSQEWFKASGTVAWIRALHASIFSAPHLSYICHMYFETELIVWTDSALQTDRFCMAWSLNQWIESRSRQFEREMVQAVTYFLYCFNNWRLLQRIKGLMHTHAHVSHVGVLCLFLLSGSIKLWCFHYQSSLV